MEEFFFLYTSGTPGLTTLNAGNKAGSILCLMLALLQAKCKHIMHDIAKNDADTLYRIIHGFELMLGYTQ